MQDKARVASAKGKAHLKENKSSHLGGLGKCVQCSKYEWVGQEFKVTGSGGGIGGV